MSSRQTAGRHSDQCLSCANSWWPLCDIWGAELRETGQAALEGRQGHAWVNRVGPFRLHDLQAM